MLLARKTTISISGDYANIIGHMCYAAYKLWNICNYERMHHEELNLPSYPNWYYQKKAHKDNIWYKQLPAQTAQEVCKQLDGGWKSFFKLKKTHGIESPKPPRFKHENMEINFIQNGVVHQKGSDTIRLSLSKSLKEFMADRYDIHETYLYLKNRIFENMDTIKQIKVYPPVNGKCIVIATYEIPDVQSLPDNGKYLSIDLGVHNLLTCYNSDTGETFIAGRKYLALCHYYFKEIARVQSQWSTQQSRKGIKYPKPSKHINRLYKRKNDAIRDYLHKVTRSIVTYCKEQDIHTVVIGDITGIREDKDFYNDSTNQEFHALPYKKIYQMLRYKLEMKGINFVMRPEYYSSQTSPLMPEVNEANAQKSNRVYRGLYQDGTQFWNADCVGAFNILRLYFQTNNIFIKLNPFGIKNPYVLKVAA